MPIIVVDFHWTGRDLFSECIDRRKFRIKKDISVIAGQIQKAVKEVVKINNAPKQVKIRLSDIFYETKIPRLSCPFNEENLAQYLQRTDPKTQITLFVNLSTQEKADRALAMAMCLHPRLGRDSPLQMLDFDTMREVVRRVFLWYQ